MKILVIIEVVADGHCLNDRGQIPMTGWRMGRCTELLVS